MYTTIYSKYSKKKNISCINEIIITLSVKNNNKNIVYSQYSSLKLTQHIRDKLKENKWDIKKIRKYEETYPIEKPKDLHYYDTTDIFQHTNK